ncbi:MAG TPA: RHS repeat-associated core domain-containing protein [Streptosporangiaceae bacterium]|nr:RHS repeat-associated core domain-containing protein [Streptosporangiaceae bacterium]
MAPVQGVLPSLPAVALTATVTTAAAVAAVLAGPVLPAKASASGSVLILSTSVNGGTSSAEAQQASALGLSVTVDTPTQWDALTATQFQAYSAIIIGDPSTSTSCATAVPPDALSTAGTWGPAVTGNVAVLGTAPALAGATALIRDAIAYAASGSGTGLYASLNCEYSTASAGTPVPLLAYVDDPAQASANFTVTGQNANCPSAAGTVNTWQALAYSQFNGLTSANLGPWPSPDCSVQETFSAWPAGLGGLAYDTGASPATFTASDGATGQAYILAGPAAAASTTAYDATTALAPATGGQVPAMAAADGGSNPAAPGVSQPLAGGANTENGDYSASSTDASVPTFGPSLDFTRSYDSQAAQQQTQTGTPGQMGYGWTDNWASSLSTASPVPGDIYTTDGLRTDTGDGGPPAGVLGAPDTVVQNGSDVYIVDLADNRIEEIPGTSKTQWGRSMTAGDMYTVAGSPSGQQGSTHGGSALSGFLMFAPAGLTFDSSGNMIISDSGNDRILAVPAASGTYFGVSMTAGNVYEIAGHDNNPGHSGDGGPAVTCFLNDPQGISVGRHGTDLYIADAGNNRIQEIYGNGQSWGQSMTANDIYTVAGSATGTSGDSGDGGAASSALLSTPEDVVFSGTSDMYIADTGNNQVREVANAAGTQWGMSASMTANDIYTIAGQANGTAGTSGDGSSVASGALHLNSPVGIALNNGAQLYIADAGNNRIQEIAQTTHTEWGIAMTAFDMYTIAGQASGACGFSGNGGPATAAKLCFPVGISVGSSMYIADESNNRVRFVDSADTISAYAGNGWQVATAGNGGPAIDAGLFNPEGEAFDPAGDVYIADAWNNRIQEIAAHSHTQFGIAMTAGDVYTVAGNAQAGSGHGGDGGLATAAFLFLPQSIAADGAGNLYIADSDNCRVQKVSASTGDISTVAGGSSGPSACGTYTSSMNGGAATSASLSQLQGVAVDARGDLYLADTFNNRVEEVYEGGQSFGQPMTAGDIYTIAGTGTQGFSGDRGAATSATVNDPDALGVDGTGNLYISDWGNNRIREVPVTTGTQRGQAMTRYDIYTIAGNGGTGTAGNGGPATSANLNGPGNATVDPAGNLYITDTANNRVQEVPAASGVQWGQSMTANYVYTVAGSATGTAGNSGDGGPATSARLTVAENVSTDPEGDLYITDHNNDRLREVVSATPATIAPAPGLTSALYPAPGGITVTQPGGAQVTFYSASGGRCGTAPYTQVAGQYCVLPQDVGASLTLSSGTYTFNPAPGSVYTYNSAGQFTSEYGQDGEALSLSYGSPLPGQSDPQGVTCPSGATSCMTITAAVGSGGTARTLVIGLNSSSFVTSVTDPMGRTWNYGYTTTNGMTDLTSATDPMGKATTYTYDSGNANPLLVNDMVTITDPNGQPTGADPGVHTTVAYDSSGRVMSRTDPMGYQTSYNWTTFNPSTGSGFITVTDPDGNKTVYYYIQGTIAAQSEWTGPTLTSERDYVPDQTVTPGDNSAGTQLDIATADGNGTVTISYDARGNRVSTTSPSGTTTMQATALNGPDCYSGITSSSTCSQASGPSPVTHGGVITPPSSAPPQGVTWTLYDDYGNELYTTAGVYEPGSNAAAYSQTTYQLFKGNTVTLNGNNISCTATPPSALLPCATIDAKGVVTQLAYDAQGDLISSSTPDGNGTELATTTYAYDSDGEQTSTTSPDGNLPSANVGNYTTTATWNADGEQTSVTHAGGTGATVTPRTTNYGYDADGNRINDIDPRGYETVTAYNAADEGTLATDPDNNSALTCYDGDGHVTQAVPPAGVAANSLTAASCPSSYPAGYGQRLATDATTYTFNALNELTQQTTPAPAGQSGYETTSYAYDGSGRLIQTTSPPTINGGPSQVTVGTYNSEGQLASETTGYGTSAASTVSYCYDPAGHTTSVVYADGNTSGVAECETTSPWVINSSSYPTQASYQTTYSYDSVGELVSVTRPATSAAPSGAATSFTYDPTGNQLTATDPNGVTATMTYTPAGNEASVTYSGSSAHSASYAFDANGNMTSMTDATGTSAYSYDPFDELTSAENGASQTVGYGYDADGNTTAITYPLPAGATWAASSIVNYTYDNANLLTKVTDFNGNPITIGSTADGLPNSAGLGSTGDTVTTSYDNTDAPSVISLTNSSTTLQSFSYSDAPASTILSECDTTPSCSQPSAAYTYDAKGRVASMTRNGGTAMNYGFDPSGNLTTLPDGASATTGYDKAGELTSSLLNGVTTSYSYNAGGQRLTATQGSTIASGTWNGAGQLTGYTSPAGSMTGAAYDGEGLRASATFTPSGGSPVTESYVWDTTSDTPALLMDSASAYIYAGGNAPAEQVNLATGAVTYLVTDSLGSVRGTVNGSGALTGTTSYDAWGNPVTSGGLTASTPFGYAGGYTDPTGLVYLINRYYDPSTGQFTSLDPLVDQTLQPYAYTAGDPVSQTDPTGLYLPPEGGGSPSPHHHRKPSPGSGGAASKFNPYPWLKREHDTAVAATAFNVGLQFREDFGLSTAELLKGFRVEHYIEGVSKTEGAKYGRADLTFAYHHIVWVWEIKSDGYPADIIRDEVELYVAGLHAAGRNAVPGIPLDPGDVAVPTWRGVMTVRNALPGDGSTGAVTYTKISLRGLKPGEEPRSVPVRVLVRLAVRDTAEVAAGVVGAAGILLGLARVALELEPTFG